MTNQSTPCSLSAMYRLVLMSACLAAAVAAPGANAQTPVKATTGPYVSAALGWGITSFKSDDFSPASIGGALGLPPGGVTRSDSPNSFGYKLNAGYRFNEWLGAEIGVVDLGEAKYDYRVSSPALDLTALYRTKAVTLAGVASMPVAPSVALFGKLGVAFTEATNDLAARASGLRASASAKTRKNNLYAGVGAEYRVNATLSMIGEYEYFGAVGDEANTGRARAQLLSVGVRYSF